MEPIYETARSSLLQPKLEPVSNVLVLVDSHVPCPSPEGSKSGFAKEEKEVADEIQSAEVTDAKLKQTDAQVEQLEDEKGASRYFTCCSGRFDVHCPLHTAFSFWKIDYFS